MPYRPKKSPQKRQDEADGYSVLRHRETKQIVNVPSPAYSKEFPYTAISPNAVVWRYQEWKWYKKEIELSVLTFKRADQFKDKMEGTLSPQGVHGTSRTEQAFDRSHRITSVEYKQLVQNQEIDRRATFIHCWHINQTENPDMWRDYTETYDSVAVASTPLALWVALPSGMMIGRVSYLKKRHPKPRLDHQSLYYCKDQRYWREAEMRLSTKILPGQTVEWDNPDHYRMNVPIHGLYIHRLVCHPKMGDQTRREIKIHLEKYCPGLTAEESKFA